MSSHEEIVFSSASEKKPRISLAVGYFFLIIPLGVMLSISGASNVIVILTVLAVFLFIVVLYKKSLTRISFESERVAFYLGESERKISRKDIRGVKLIPLNSSFMCFVIVNLLSRHMPLVRYWISPVSSRGGFSETVDAVRSEFDSFLLKNGQ